MCSWRPPARSRSRSLPRWSSTLPSERCYYVYGSVGAVRITAAIKTDTPRAHRRPRARSTDYGKRVILRYAQRRARRVAACRRSFLPLRQLPLPGRRRADCAGAAKTAGKPLDECREIRYTAVGQAQVAERQTPLGSGPSEAKPHRGSNPRLGTIVYRPSMITVIGGFLFFIPASEDLLARREGKCRGNATNQRFRRLIMWDELLRFRHGLCASAVMAFDCRSTSKRSVATIDRASCPVALSILGIAGSRRIDFGR